MAVSGQPGPDSVPGSVYTTSLLRPTINNRGHVSFTSSLAASDGTGLSELGIFVATPERQQRSVMFRGGQVPGTKPGSFYRSFETLAFNDQGRIVIGTGMDGDAVDFRDNFAIVTDSVVGGGLTAIAQEDRAITGLPAGAVFDRLDNVDELSMTADGVIAFTAEIEVDNQREAYAVLRYRPDTGFESVATTGQQIPGGPFGTSYGRIFDSTHINAKGRVAFGTEFSGEGFDLNTQRGIAGDVGTGVTRVLVTPGDPVINALPTTTIERAGGPRINDRGGLTFGGLQINDGSVRSNSFGVFRLDDQGRVLAVALENQQVPGLSEGVQYEQFRRWDIDNRGSIAFLARIQNPFGSAGEALSVQSITGDTRVIAATGMSIDTPVGTLEFEGIIDEPIALGSNGQLALVAETAIGNGVFATDLAGALIAIGLPGMQIDINPDPDVEDIRTIFGITDDISINDRGVVAFAARFTDDHHAIVTVAIPAPASAIGVCGGLFLLRRRRA